MVAGELVFAVRHESALVQRQATGRQVVYKFHQILERIALNIELTARPVLHHRGDFIDVVTPDVPLVGARMHGDAIRSSFKA